MGISLVSSFVVTVLLLWRILPQDIDYKQKGKIIGIFYGPSFLGVVASGLALSTVFFLVSRNPYLFPPGTEPSFFDFFFTLFLRVFFYHIPLYSSCDVPPIDHSSLRLVYAISASFSLSHYGRMEFYSFRYNE